MGFKLSPCLLISFLSIFILITLPNQVKANTPLTRAEIQRLRNVVQLLQRSSRSKRPAKPADTMIPGDGLSTGRASLADLRFNDGSLARVGEQAVFQFLPRTRNFRLSNGTVLLLIPPGRGQTRIQTPSAAAAIRGSALFVRYDEQTDTTVIGALTNSGIIVSNKDASQNQELQAGQLLVVVKGRFQGLYDFDLQNFYQTSDLIQGLDLTKQNLTSASDPAIASVKAEILTALTGQAPLSGEGIIDNPSFLDLTANSDSQDTGIDNVTANTNASPVDNFVDTGEILFNNAQELGNSQEKTTIPQNGVSSDAIEQPTNPEVANPEVTNPEVTNPEVANPEVTNPEVTNPEVTNPEVTNPEVTNPEVTNPEVTNPEVTNPDIRTPDSTVESPNNNNTDNNQEIINEQENLDGQGSISTETPLR
jgi:acrosin